MSTSPRPTADHPAAAMFRLKAGLFPLTRLEISDFEAAGFAAQLREKAVAAPAFFQQLPVVISLEHFQGETEALPLAELLALCRAEGLLPVALRGDGEVLKQRAREQGLALMPASRSRDDSPRAHQDLEPSALGEEPSAAGEEPSAPGKEPSAPGEKPSAANEQPSALAQQSSAQGEPLRGLAAPLPATRIIDGPVRSGQQIYVPGGDLIVMASVSAGAEVLADGNIHVYGALRGRALAGAQGNSEARIFCQSLEAELVSVAGNFKLNDELRGELWQKPVQIHLQNQALGIVALG